MAEQKEQASHPNNSCGTWAKNATLRATWIFEAATAECCDVRNRCCNRSGLSAHHCVLGSSLRLPGSLLSDDPIDRHLLTADPYTDFQRTNDMRTAAQRALFKQHSARAVQAAGLARHRSLPREDINAGDTAMVWLDNKPGEVGLGQVLSLRCHRREPGSPQLVATYAASSAVVQMTWIKALWESMTWRDVDLLTQRRSSRPLKSLTPHVIRNENPNYYDPESTLVMDSKGLFGALDNDTSG